MSAPPSEYTGRAASGSAPEPIAEIPGPFLTRWRRGERPSVSEFVGRHAEFEEEIKDFLHALVEMEQLGTTSDTEGAGPARTASRGDSAAPAASPHPGRLPERL